MVRRLVQAHDASIGALYIAVGEVGREEGRKEGWEGGIKEEREGRRKGFFALKKSKRVERWCIDDV